MKKFLVVALTLLMVAAGLQLFAQEDPYLWLEEVLGKKSLQWVKTHSDKTAAELKAVPGFKSAYDTLLKDLNARDSITRVRKYGNYVYQNRQDAEHVRGLYCRTTLEEYRKPNPKWEPILDIDALAKKENENWVFKEWRGMVFNPTNPSRAMLHLSRGGGDAVVIREFDLDTRSFVKDGFTLKESKQWVFWRDNDYLFIATDFGKGSFTKSGFPRFVKLWKRGTPLKDAKTLLEVNENSIWVYARRLTCGDDYVELVTEGITFWKQITYVYKNGKLHKLDLPLDAELSGYFKKQLIVALKSDLKAGETIFKQGSLVSVKVADLLAGKPAYQLLIGPGPRVSVNDQFIHITKNMVLVPVLDNVKCKLLLYTQDKNGEWQTKRLPINENGALFLYQADERNDQCFFTYQNFLTPMSIYMVDGAGGKVEKLKSAPHRFNPDSLMVKQNHAVSKDGTRVPYFMVMRKDLKLDGNNPTLLYGYGGFRASTTPSYSGPRGKLWFEKGGVYVTANIRGGGEFGPQWHKAAILKNKRKSYEDFIAVAEDLVKRKVTSPEKLAIRGASNGGLLVGAVFTMRPDLFKAVVCRVPLLDMKRYTKLLAGASWAAEYGDPDDPDMWNYIKTYSPYHNVKKGLKYPKVFFVTSTRDDRVHPGHARKMAAKMMDMGYGLYFYENTEGGHGAAANNKQRAFMNALSYAYLYKMLMGK